MVKVQNIFSDWLIVKYPIKTIIVIPINKLIKCWPLKVIGYPDISPCNFKNAIHEPEKVIAPIETPMDISIKDANLILPKVPIPKESGL